MTLRKKTLLISGTALVFLLAAVYFLSSRILLGGFTDLEKSETVRNVERVVGAIKNDTMEMAGITRDWATWDDTYAYIADRNDAYFEGNLAEDTSWVNNKINLMMFVDAAGDIVYAGAYDLVNQIRLEVPASVLAQVKPGSPLLDHSGSLDGKEGIIDLPEAPMMIASYPILPSDRQGPARGSLIWGRYLDAARLSHHSNTTRLTAALAALDGSLPQDFQDAHGAMSAGEPTPVRPLESGNVAGYTIIEDILGQPTLMLRVDSPRQIYAQGQTTQKYLLLSLLSAGLLFGLFSAVSLEKWVILPTSHLSRAMSRIGATSDHSARIETSGGKDEISRLSEVINETLEALEVSQKEVQMAREHLEKRVNERTEQLSEKVAALETLAEIDRDVIAMNEPQAILDLACRRAAGLMHATKSLIKLKAGNGDQIASVYGFTAGELENQSTRDILADQTGACVQVPLVAEGQELGSLIVCDSPRDRWRSDDLQVLHLLGNQVALAIDEARLFVAEQTRRDELSSLYELSRALVDAPPDASPILDLVTRHSVDTVHVTFARIALLEDGQMVWRSAHPIRNLEPDLALGKKTPVAALPAVYRLLGSPIPRILRDTDAGLSDEERQFLSLNLAHAVCIVPLIAGDKLLGVLLMGEERREEREPFTPEKLSLAHSIGDQTTSALKRAELFIALEDGYLDTVMALAKAVEVKDNYTSGHAEDIAVMAVAVGQQIGMAGKDLEDLRFGATLHDIGKIGVPDEILNKPGKLDEDDWRQMKKHPVAGSQILAPVPRLAAASTIVRHHHESYGGGGYPDGLAGADIPLGSRILAVVDAYGAMIDKRTYKEAMTREQAFAELKSCSGSQFDPRIVTTFIDLIERGLARS